MAVKLERRPRFAAGVSHDDRRRARVAAGRAFYRKAVGSQNLGKAITHGAGITGRAGYFDQPHCGLEQALTLNVSFQLLDSCGNWFHEVRL
jgi:hypothetical protein